MITKHFLKILSIFIIMIILGLIGIFSVNLFDKETGQTTGDKGIQTKVAK